MEKIYAFWFKFETEYWFLQDDQKDKIIVEKFFNCLQDAEKNKLNDWVLCKKGFISLILILDQFSRHIYRGSADAYKNDCIAVEIVKKFLPFYLHQLSPKEALFVLLPFQHSINKNDQKIGIVYLQYLINKFPKSKILKQALVHQRGHLRVLEKFGRFPKRLSKSKLNQKEIEYIKKTPELPY